MRILSFLFCAGILMSSITGPVEAQTIRIRMNKEKKEVPLNFLLDNENLFAMTPEEFEKTAGKKNFVWQDKERTRARFNPDKYQYTLKDKKVGEVLVNFSNGKFASAAVSVLNKGDEDELIDRSTFSEAVSSVKSMLGAASGGKEEPRKKEEMITKAEGSVWRSKKALYIGEWLFLDTKREEADGYFWIMKAHGEFVRIRIMPPQAQLGMQLAKLKVGVTRPVLASRVKREGKTKAVIDLVPMVDQGSKGYCAVASFERVLRYYGADVDMHDLANLAETYGGTDPQKMKSAVTKVSQKLSLRTKESFFLKRKQTESMFKEYNRYAIKLQKTEVDPMRIDWKEVDFEVLKASRTASPEYKKFKQDLVTYINSGIPIMWALQLGLFWEDKIEESFEANRYAISKDGDDEDKEAKEDAEDRAKDMEEARKKDPKRPPWWMGGGHMRLIVGYDAAKQLVFYTDSWGPGHEMKSMPIDQAWAATLGLFVLEPQ
jgi:hypothetical protein